MNPCELTASVTAIANALACGLTVNEINLLGAVLLSILCSHDTMVTKLIVRLTAPLH